MNTAPTATTRKLRVVIADDSEPVRSRIALVIGKLKGVELVGAAKEARECLHVLREQSPDVTILDLNMPNGGGFAVMDGIKRLPAAPVVIILTNYSDSYIRAKCETAGAAYFFDKSNEFEEAIGTLKAIESNRDFHLVSTPA